MSAIPLWTAPDVAKLSVTGPIYADHGSRVLGKLNGWIASVPALSGIALVGARMVLEPAGFTDIAVRHREPEGDQDGFLAITAKAPDGMGVGAGVSYSAKTTPQPDVGTAHQIALHLAQQGAKAKTP